MKDFSYAESLLGGCVSNEFSHSAMRDHIFKEVLGQFIPNAVTVFQVGAIETFETKFRSGSGWSDIIFGEYISAYGGLLKVVDINLDHIANSTYAALKMGYEISTSLGDAVEFIVPGFDIYYLDGADEPLGNSQTLEQFKKIEGTDCVVFVDDVPTKGQLLLPHLEEMGYHYDYHRVANGMLTIDMREK